MLTWFSKHYIFHASNKENCEYHGKLHPPYSTADQFKIAGVVESQCGQLISQLPKVLSVGCCLSRLLYRLDKYTYVIVSCVFKDDLDLKSLKQISN